MRAKSFKFTVPQTGEQGRLLVGLSLAQVEAEGRRDLLVNLSVLFGELIALLIYSSMTLSRMVIQPITTIMSSMRKLRDGDLTTRAHIKRADEIGILADTYNFMVQGLSEREKLKDAFNRYVSKQVYKQLEAGAIRLTGEQREATILFSDIRSFTALSEQLTPPDVVAMLNEYFNEMVEIVFKHDGFLNKFIGDSLMVVFNGPIDQPDHAERSVRCALGMHDAVARLNQAGAFAAVGELRTGVGIATGTMITGNIGSPRQMEYTVIGDVVNTAARLCAIAAGAETLVTQATAGALPATLPTRMLEPVTLKGKREAIAVARVEVLDADDAEHRCKDQRKERQGHQKISAVSPS
jgi:adenylate cyclase